MLWMPQQMVYVYILIVLFNIEDLLLKEQVERHILVCSL